MITAVGALGALVILVFFFLNQTHKLSQDSLWYDIGNFVGSFLLVWYAYMLASTPFLVLNLIWLAVSLKDIFSDLKKR